MAVETRPAQRRAPASPYAGLIREILAAHGTVEHDPRHVEAYMRLEHSTLDHLPRERFGAEVRIAVACIRHAGPEMAERCARSFGM